MHRNPARYNLAYPSFICLSLLLFAVPESSVGTLRAEAHSLLRPLLQMTAHTSRSAQLLPASIGIQDPKDPSARPENQNKNSAAEYDVLSAQCVRLRNAIQHARTLVSPKDGLVDDPPGIEADVIARRVMWQEPLLGLDKGSAEGVRNDAGVMHRGAVVGRVVAVGSHASSIALLTHRSMSIGARLADCRVEGVLQGQKSNDGSERFCRLQITAKELKATVGEYVVTSGLDGTFPAGLWLGAVTKINRTGDFQWELIVRPACDENRVESVHILTVQPPEVPWPQMPKK